MERAVRMAFEWRVAMGGPPGPTGPGAGDCGEDPSAVPVRDFSESEC